MSFQYYMPTKIVMGKNCIKENPELFSDFGKKAIVVTGKHSAKANGSLNDIVSVFEQENIEYCLFDKVNSNPDIDTVYEGAEFAKANNAEFVVAIGGGSPMDAAKAIALLSAQNVEKDDLFSGKYENKILPMIFVPTTAGTGSEVTQYSILTNHKAKTKTTLSTSFMFPDVALLDERYMKNLSQKTTVNTAIDALTHLIESYLSVKANAVTKALSLEGIRMIASEFKNLAEFSLDDEARRKLLIASTFGGMVIAQTGTTAVHSMGYSLTYFKNIDHGRANGLLIAEFLKFVQDKMSSDVDEILKALNMEDLDEFSAVIDGLLKEKEDISEDELKDFSQIAIKAKNIMNCSVVLNADDLLKIYRSSFKK